MIAQIKDSATLIALKEQHENLMKILYIQLENARKIILLWIDI